MSRGSAVLLVLAWVGVSCTDLERYEGSFTGSVVGAADVSFIRRGFAAGTALTLMLDPGSGSAPSGVLTTSDGIFDGTELRRIEPLAHDHLSDFDFPGEGRVRNYLLVATTTDGGPARPAREAYVFLSLMRDGTVEIRVVAGTGEAEGDLFGLFKLQRRG